LRCGDGSLYTGITNDLEKRLKMHANGKGAKYTRGREPLEVFHTETFRTKGFALKREAVIKSLGRQDKLALALAP
jgi:putative endonuclease